MAKKQEQTDRMVAIIDKLVADVDPQDAIIIGMGFIAGMYGGTIIDELARGNSAQKNNPVFSKLDAAKTDPLYAYALSQAFILTGGSPLLTLLVSPFLPTSPGGSSTTITESDQQKLQQMIMLIIAGGCIGAVAAYALTRPGAIEGIGNLINGLIPSVVPV